MNQIKKIYLISFNGVAVFAGSNIKVLIAALKKEIPDYYWSYIKSYSQYTRDFKFNKTLYIAIPNRSPYILSEMPVYSKIV